MTDHEAMLAIQELMDGVEWNSDTLDAIGAIMTKAGYRLRDLDDRDVEADAAARTAEMFAGPVIAVEWQLDPITPGRFAVYTRHDDAPDFKPAQFIASHVDKADAEVTAKNLARIYRVPLEWKGN